MKPKGKKPNRPCPYCKTGQLVTKTREHTMKHDGVPYVVKDAKISQCDNCGGMVFRASERKRWIQELKAKQKELRKKLDELAVLEKKYGVYGVGILTDPNNPSITTEEAIDYVLAFVKQAAEIVRSRPN